MFGLLFAVGSSATENVHPCAVKRRENDVRRSVVGWGTKPFEGSEVTRDAERNEKCGREVAHRGIFNVWTVVWESPNGMLFEVDRSALLGTWKHSGESEASTSWSMGGPGQDGSRGGITIMLFLSRVRRLGHLLPGPRPPDGCVQLVSRKLAVHYTYQNSPIPLEVFFVLDLVRSSVLGWCAWQGLKELAQLLLALLS